MLQVATSGRSGACKRNVQSQVQRLRSFSAVALLVGKSAPVLRSCSPRHLSLQALHNILSQHPLSLRSLPLILYCWNYPQPVMLRTVFFCLVAALMVATVAADDWSGWSQGRATHVGLGEVGWRRLWVEWLNAQLPAYMGGHSQLAAAALYRPASRRCAC
jgi:hypothetical protein